MVTGIESFKEWFREYKDHYVIIGGTACDILMAEEGMDFRATKDIDLVLMVEAISADFGRVFWEYVKAGDISIVIKTLACRSFIGSVIRCQSSTLQ